MKKLIHLTLILLIMLLSACDNENYPELYKTYYGNNPSGYVLPGTDNESGSEVSVRVDKNSIYINDVESEYEIEEENDNILIIHTTTDTEGQDRELTFRYDKAKDQLTLNPEADEEIVLVSREKMLAENLDSFAEARLTTDLSHLSSKQKEMLGLLFDAAKIMDDIYWFEAYGNKSRLMGSTENDTLRRLFEINYGPWERLNNNQPLLPRYGEKPAGANFYPHDMTREEFEAFDDPAKTSQYTIIKRDENGNLKTVWYHEEFEDQVKQAASLLQKAADLAEDAGFAEYLRKRAEALLSDNYYASDVAWMKMKNNDIDIVIGPIENYEDQLYNLKAAHESFILVKDPEWSKRLARLSALLPMLQRELPVEDKFKQEKPSTNSDINVYDALYYAGDCNAGSKTIAINLPNDPEVRSKYGSRKLQLKNSIRYKFEKILVPISNVLIAEDQRQYIDFDAFFENTMFHEVAHGLGVDYTINDKGQVRPAMKETYTSLEESKADILGLYIVTKLTEMGELGDKDLMKNYVTFMAGIFRSVRFGASSAHGKANMIRFYYFEEAGAFSRDETTGTYRVNFEKMKEAMENLTREIITLQGLGDYEGAKNLIAEKGYIRKDLQNDLNRLDKLNIPVDLVFEQGKDIAGLQ